MVEAAFNATAGTELDTFPITINYIDGTSEATNVINGHSEASRNGPYQTITTIKTFEKMISNKEIKSITFFDEEILLK